MEWDSLLITTLKQYIENVHYQLELIWINVKKKKPKAIFMLAVCLVLHLAFPLEHSKIKMSEPLNPLRTRLMLETFKDYAPVLTRWLPK